MSVRWNLQDHKCGVSKLHIAKLATHYGQHAHVDTLCGRTVRRAIGHALWGLVGHNRRDKCSQCVDAYRKHKRIK